MLAVYALSRSRFYEVAAWLTCVTIQGVAFATALFVDEPWVLLGYATAPIVLSGIVLSTRAPLVFSVLAMASLAGRHALAGEADLAVYFSVVVPYVAIVTLLVVLGSSVRDKLENDRLAEVAESEARYRRLFDQTFEGYAVLRDGVCIDLAGRLAELLEVPPDALLGHACIDAFGAKAPEVRALLERGGAMEISVEAPSGRVLELELLATEAPWQGAKATFLALRDNSERRRVARLLEASERAVALGQVAAGVAHEVNNPLTFITANLSLIPDMLGAHASTIEEELREMREGAERIRVVVNDLRALSRSSTKLEPTDLHATIELALRMTQNEVKLRATVVRDFGEVPLIQANATRLGQVFVNLIVNAARAIPEGAPDENKITVVTRMEHDEVLVEVRDTGPGIPADVMPRIFDPFYTTREVGGGMGLGLSICQTILKAHGSHLEVATGPKGTTCSMKLKVASEPPTVSAPPATAAAASRRKALVIDDESLILRTASRALKAKGYDVDTAESAKEGLEKARAGHYDVIVCDLVMPGKGGMHVYSELAKDGAGKERRVVIMSGGAFTTQARESLVRFPGILVDKPFVPATLLEACDRAIAAAG